MIHYEHFQLDNGLQVYVHQDKSTPMAAVNIVYNVGSKDESEDKTGFAHLFEHLMFGGSANIPSYDEPVQLVGGQNNAFTSPDLTNYYITLPAENLETAFWLESDRMKSLSFDPKVLEVQRKVVIEEFKQRYLNQPYGDVWLKLRPLAYTTHPYRWATIGKEIRHIEEAVMQDVKDFFFKFYLPNNATLVVAGNVTTKQVKELAEKWFGPILPGEKYERNIPQEPAQTAARFSETSAKVPLSAIYKTYHMPGKYDDDFYDADLISDVLGRSKSSRLYQSLVKEQKLFSSINAYVTASVDPGLLIVSGNLNKGIAPEQGNEAIELIVKEIAEEKIAASELEKVKNQAESSHDFSQVELLNRAMSIAFAANHGDASLCNADTQKLAKVTPESLNLMAKKIMQPENCSTLFYNSNM